MYTLCGSTPVPPGPETIRTLQGLLASALPGGEQATFQEQRERGRRLQDSRYLTATSKQVAGAVLRLHVVASPGPSGIRNYCTQAIAECRGGAEVLRRWCDATVAGNDGMGVEAMGRRHGASIR